MRGWLDAVPLIRTEYALLLHNDGYALDSFFACELVQSLKARDASYVVAAPMLYESKADGSLAAHATQSRLRQGGPSARDHSVAKALNRGGDIPEGDQADFLEDHGFVIKTQAIAGIIDPHASYTLEYIDMILSLKANKWKRGHVPRHAGLPREMARKVPNTGFWTYIKYTIVESHEYPASEISVLPWKQQASLFLGFFQMAGFNVRAVGAGATYVDLLMELDSGAYEAKQAGYFSSDSVALDGVATRELKRASRSRRRVADALGSGPGQFWAGFCGVAVQKPDGCECWVNMPTFKSRSLVADVLARVASVLKVPSRITAHLEMALGSTNPAGRHVAPVERGWQARVTKALAANAESLARDAVHFGFSGRTRSRRPRPAVRAPAALAALN
ncbi:FK506 binding protein [Aureococcus anophagefferens]|nr:FK506 binding protein [Aureococcus anophagefferens]